MIYKIAGIQKLNSMKKYKFRAECSIDIVRWLNIVHHKLISFEMTRGSDLMDCYFTFETKMDIYEILTTLDEVVDSHVMMQTVKRIGEYTGIRDAWYESERTEQTN